MSIVLLLIVVLFYWLRRGVCSLVLQEFWFASPLDLSIKNMSDARMKDDDSTLEFSNSRRAGLILRNFQ
jgi:hypothetical protein